MDNLNVENLKITPHSRYCYGVGIRKEKGDIFGSENILSADNATTIIKYHKNGVKPRLVIDLGEASPGGYPVFTVKSKVGIPVLRISYADYYGYIDNENYDTTGDFLRGDCKYLGVELPVLPANPNRFELYTINRTGKFIYPLIQGQQRFVLITLENEDVEIELESFFIYYTSDLSPFDGSFKCSNDKLNRLWYASTYTAQIASIDNSCSWEIVEGLLALRALTKGNRAGIYKKGLSFKDYTFEFSGQISINPHVASGIGWLVRATDIDNGYMIRLDLDGLLSFYIRKDAVNKPFAHSIYLDFPIIDNTNYNIKTQVQGSSIKIYIDDKFICELVDDTFSTGTIGFCQTVEKWAIVNFLKVYDNDEILLRENFSNGLDDYEFTRAPSFVSDGAKRDRLPWSGDLYWAGRNIYAAFSNFDYMLNTIKMLGRHQTPEGYIWATCYPEDVNVPEKGEYGYYESDIFSAWFVIVLGDYLLYTGDIEGTKENYSAALKTLDYVWEFVDAEGVFFQRYETSKGLWDHQLNDFGKYAYNNLIMNFAFVKCAFIAEKLGDYKKQKEYLKKAKIIENAINKYFWNEKGKYFRVSTKSDALCPLSNSIALDMKFATEEKGIEIANSMTNWLRTGSAHGKIISLFISGCFLYTGLQKRAYEMMMGSVGNTDIEGSGGVNWIDCINDKDCPATTTECMFYPINMDVIGHAWGDRSHPDTGVAHIITGYILGVRPIDIGFKKFIFKPHFLDLENACGEVPTPYGNIKVSWEIKDGESNIRVSYPKEIEMFTETTNIEIYQLDNSNRVPTKTVNKQTKVFALGRSSR